MSENTTSGRTVLGGAHEALRTAVRGVPAADRDLPAPYKKWTVAQVLQHATGDQLAYAAVVGPSDDDADALLRHLGRALRRTPERSPPGAGRDAPAGARRRFSGTCSPGVQAEVAQPSGTKPTA